MQIPYCLAMVLCDAVHRDPATGKFTLLGTFSHLRAGERPIRGQFMVYFAITDGNGTVPVGLRIVDSQSLVGDESKTRPPLVDIVGEVQFPDPLAIVEGVLGIQVEFPEPGVYHCELYAGSDLLMSRRLLVTAPEETTSDDDE